MYQKAAILMMYRKSKVSKNLEVAVNHIDFEKHKSVQRQFERKRLRSKK